MELKTLVIGGNLKALLYSFINDFPLIYCHPKLPSKIESDIFLYREFEASELWKNLYFLLSLQGNILFADKIDNLRIEEPLLKVFTKRARLYEVNFERLIIFDDDHLTGIPPELAIPAKEIYEVRDWINVRSGMKHDHDRINDTTDFVNHILFYPSQRVEGNHHFKDVVAVSYLTKEMIDLFEYSDINARFKTFYMMKKARIKGARNGRDMLDKNRYKYYSIKIENDRREIIKKLKKYNSSERYIFNYESVDAIIKTLHLESDVSRIFRKYIYR